MQLGLTVGILHYFKTTVGTGGATIMYKSIFHCIVYRSRSTLIVHTEETSKSVDRQGTRGFSIFPLSFPYNLVLVIMIQIDILPGSTTTILPLSSSSSKRHSLHSIHSTLNPSNRISAPITSTACLVSNTRLHSATQSPLNTPAHPSRVFTSLAAPSKSPCSNRRSAFPSTPSTSPAPLPASTPCSAAVEPGVSGVSAPTFLKSSLLSAQLAACDAIPASVGSKLALRTSRATPLKRSMSCAVVGIPRW